MYSEGRASPVQAEAQACDHMGLFSQRQEAAGGLLTVTILMDN